MAGGAPGPGALADPGGGAGALDQQLARLPAALQGLQDRAVGEAVKQAGDLVGDHVLDLHRGGTGAVAVVLDGGGSALTTGTKCDLALPRAYVVEGWVLYADAAGSLVVDLQTAASYTAFPTTASICASAKPTLSGAQKATDSALAGWTTALPADGVLRVIVDSAATITLATLTLLLRAA